MIKTILLLFVGMSFALVSTLSSVPGKEEIETNTTPVQWLKPEKNFWLGADYKSYRLDSNQVLQISDDFMNWRNCEDSSWKGRFGSRLCYHHHTLFQTYNNKDEDWEEVTDRTWQSIDGNWYRFDMDGVLWKSSDGSLIAGN
jgi:hypothetical protein